MLFSLGSRFTMGGDKGSTAGVCHVASRYVAKGPGSHVWTGLRLSTDEGRLDLLSLESGTEGSARVESPSV